MILGAPVRRSVPLGGGAARVELTDGRTVVVKEGPGVAAEAAGLRWLAVPGGPPVPAVLALDGVRLVTVYVPPGRPSGYWESYKSEIAAYELDKLLGMVMVPVSVEKRWKGQTAAAILWLTPIHPWKEMEPRPKPGKWVRQVARMKMFDNFICNKDRNAGNLLVDDDWNLFLIDHSRAFITDKDLAVKMEHIDPEVWNRMLALDEPALTAAIGKWVEGGVVRSILARREKMKMAIDKLVAANGEAAVFLK